MKFPMVPLPESTEPREPIELHVATYVVRVKHLLPNISCTLEELEAARFDVNKMLKENLERWERKTYE